MVNGLRFTLALPWHTHDKFGAGFVAARARLLQAGNVTEWEAKRDVAFNRASMTCWGPRGDSRTDHPLSPIDPDPPRPDRDQQMSCHFGEPAACF
eukprot:gene4387-5079_t